MKKIKIILFLGVIVFAIIRCNKAYDFPDDGYDDRLSGGAATIFDATSKAFTHPVDGLSTRDLQVHELGDASFEQTFVSAPAPVHSGLGPIFNNVSCISCHHNDGKGTPTAGFNNSSLLIRVSLPGEDATGAPLSIPGFGFQLQDQSVFSSTPEAHVNITYTDVPVTYPDGTLVTLRKPTYTLVNPYISLPAVYNISPRMAPPVFGLGLLEDIPEGTILSFADPDGHDPDKHNLELIFFPKDKGQAKWQKPNGKLFLGIDHTAIGVSNTDSSLKFYRDILGFERKGDSWNKGIEQAHLNFVEDASLHITGLRAAEGPGIEFLQYLTPGPGRPYPSDSRTDDIWHWQTTLITDDAAKLYDELRMNSYKIISKHPVHLQTKDGKHSQAFIVRDNDGHAMLIREVIK